MQYSWATVGAKVQYIGPSVLMHYNRRGDYIGDEPSRLNSTHTYTIIEARSHPVRPHELSIRLVEDPKAMYPARLFRPLQKKDEETFNELLTNLPHDLTVEHAFDIIEEKIKVLEDGWR